MACYYEGMSKPAQTSQSTPEERLAALSDKILRLNRGDLSNPQLFMGDTQLFLQLRQNLLEFVAAYRSNAPLETVETLAKQLEGGLFAFESMRFIATADILKLVDEIQDLVALKHP
jgi:hypothetical protein